jgi:hypothetical protein
VAEVDSDAKQKFSNMDVGEMPTSDTKEDPTNGKNGTTDTFAAFNFDKAPETDVKKSDDPFGSFNSFDSFDSNNKPEPQGKVDTDLFATFK